MPSRRALALLAACALALLLFTALMSSAAASEEKAQPPSQQRTPGQAQVVLLAEGDVSKDFGRDFANENREELRRWEEGEHASDPLDGAAPMSRADRRRADPKTKFDKFDEGMLEGAVAPKADPADGQARSQPWRSQVATQKLEELRRAGQEIREEERQRGARTALPIAFNSEIGELAGSGSSGSSGSSKQPVRTLEQLGDRARVKPASEWAKPESPTCYVPPGRSSCAPHFIIAGAMKCGTTSMYAYLLNHPQVLPLAPGAKLNGKAVLAEKEVRFFNDPTYTQMTGKLGIDSALDNYYDLFQEIPPPSSPYFEHHEHANMITGEASPMYICTRYAGERARGALPYGKVIIMLRNPIDRSYSEFWFRQTLSRSSTVKPGNSAPVIDDVYGDAFETCVLQEMRIAQACNHEKLISSPTMETVEEFLSCWGAAGARMREDVKEGSDFCALRERDPVCQTQYRRFCTGNNIKNSLYAHQMVEWVQAFPRSQILFIKSEDFYDDTAATMKQVEDFLGLDISLGFDWHAITGQAFNIVNPGTRSAEGREIVAGVSGLRVGASDHESVSAYPNMKPSTRSLLENFFRPHNRALQTVLGHKEPMW